MNKSIKIFCKWEFIILVLMAFSLPGCTINLNVSTDKPIYVNLVVDKPIEVKMAADVAVTKLPPIKMAP